MTIRQENRIAESPNMTAGSPAGRAHPRPFADGAAKQ